MIKFQVFRAFYATLRYLLAGALVLSLTACGALISSAKKEMAEDLSATIMAHDEPETIEQALPAYLVLVSSLIRSDDTNVELLLSGSRLYGAYASAFVEETQRKVTLSRRALEYADRAVCLKLPDACSAKTMSYHEFESMLAEAKIEDAAILFAYGEAWSSLIHANQADWNTIAELPKAKAIIERVLALDETISNGDAHIYMGVMESLLPEAMGGKPLVAREHFERALKISGRKNLMALLIYAEQYARLMFDRELHDRLLNELLAVDIRQSETMLVDTIARAKAKKLLANADNYF